VRGGAPHAKNNAKRVPKNLIDTYQMDKHILLAPMAGFGVFLTRALNRRHRPPLLLS
jgi:hypothetical protein